MQYGISGPYWYAGGAAIQIIIFSILSITLKTRAPGAKTFLQVYLPTYQLSLSLALKGQSHEIRLDLKWYHWMGLNEYGTAHDGDKRKVFLYIFCCFKNFSGIGTDKTYAYSHM